MNARSQGSTLQGQQLPVVRVISPHGSSMGRRRIPADTNKRMAGRIVHVIMLATTAFALFDLTLLLTHVQH